MVARAGCHCPCVFPEGTGSQRCGRAEERRLDLDMLLGHPQGAWGSFGTGLHRAACVCAPALPIPVLQSARVTWV